MPARWSESESDGRRFNPRLPLPGGDASGASLRPLRIFSFQSTPPVAGRRCSGQAADYVPDQSFNPRLPLPGGDAVGGAGSRRHPGVSIHASRCREAMPSAVPSPVLTTISFNPRLPLPGGDASQRWSVPITWLVSIHASRCREAMPDEEDDEDDDPEFQSTPPVAGRRCSYPVVTGRR